jgi:hypothetical protein
VGVAEGCAIVTLSPPSPRKRLVGAGLLEGVVVLFGEVESVMQVVESVPVVAHLGVGAAEVPVGDGVGGGVG